MGQYIIRIIPAFKDTLKEYGTIMFESSFSRGLMGFETDLLLEEVLKLQYVIKAEYNRTGTINV